MGTRSLVNVYDNSNEKVVTTIYRQYDGYPEGMGADIFEGFANCQVVNGYSPGAKGGEQANGMGCFAAQLIDHLKDGIGNVYIEPAGTDDVGEEFVYDLYPSTEPQGLFQVGPGEEKVNAGIMMKIRAYGDVIYNGPLSEFSPDKCERD